MIVMQGKKFSCSKRHWISQHQLIWVAQENTRITVNLLNHVKVSCKFGSLYKVCIQTTSGFLHTVENHSQNTPWPSQNPRENTEYRFSKQNEHVWTPNHSMINTRLHRMFRLQITTSIIQDSNFLPWLICFNSNNNL